MTYTKKDLQRAEETYDKLTDAFIAVTLGHTRTGNYHTKSFEQKLEDLEHIKGLVAQVTGIKKDIVLAFYDAANDMETHFDINGDMPYPRTLMCGYMHYIKPEKMCEILGYTPKKKGILAFLSK